MFIVLFYYFIYLIQMCQSAFSGQVFPIIHICECYSSTFTSTYFLCKFVTLEHKTSHKSLGYICSNSQKYIAWVKMIDFSFMPKIIRILNKD